MKKGVVVLLLVFSTWAKAQNLVDTNHIWSEILITYGWPDYYTTIYHKFMSDTVIGVNQYKKLYGTGDSSLTFWYYQAALREDSGKVYIVRYSLSSEELLYDFNLNVNDTMYLCGFSQYIILMSIDTVTLLNGENRLRFNFNWSKWIKGIGSLYGLIDYRDFFCAADIGHELNCFTEDSILKYKNTSYPTCYYTSLGIKEIDSSKPIGIYPNPTCSNSSLTFTYPFTSAKKEIIIYSIHGKEIARYALPQWSSAQTVKLLQIAGGVYVARMVGEGVSSMVKFVIE
jgi:hypothetical protein